MGNCQIFHIHGHNMLEKVACYSHAWIHTSKSSMLITAIAFHQIEASNSSSQPYNKYGEKYEREVCQLNLYPIVKLQVPTLNMTFVETILLQTPFHHLHHMLIQPICLRMVSWTHALINKCFFTQFLEFPHKILYLG